MKATALSLTAAGCLLLGLTAGCSDPAGGPSSANAAATASDIAAGVQPDPAAVALLPASVKSKGSITVALDLQYPPTSFLSAAKQPVGFNVDIAKLLAAKLGVKLDIQNVAFASIIPGLTGGRYDFTASDMSATAARLKVLDMINYWTDGSSLATKTGNPQQLDINTTSICGKSIAVMTGTTQQETYLPALSKNCAGAGKTAVNAVVLPNVDAALTQLASGRIDGIFYDTPSLAYAVKQNGSAFAVAPAQYAKPADLGTDLVAIGLRKNSDLTKAMQTAMQSIMDSPLYRKALANWGLESGAIKTASIASPSS